jgi:membrane protease YdiL (CAAX protease family)
MADQVNSRLLNAKAQQASKKLEIGWMGIVFGDAAEKPGNVAAAVIVLAFFGLMFILFFLPDSQGSSKKEALTLLGGMMTGALGFVFGRTTS